jgi:hypothetical protein
MINYADIEPKIVIRKERENYKKPNIEDMFEKILKITSDLNNKLDELDKKVNIKFEELNNKISTIETTIYSSNNLQTEDNENLKELIRENLNIDKSDVLKALSYRNYRSILMIFNLYYKNDKNKYSIRLFKVRKFEYYANKKWNADLYGIHSMEVLISNIQDLFIKYNDINYISYDEFILNQDFITQLDNEKIKKSIFKTIADEIKE